MSTDLLLVEDNPADAWFLQHTLKARYPGEYTMTVAGTLGEAESLLVQQWFDAALLDLSLPDSHGLETIGRLAAARPDLPIVVLTGMVDAAIVPQAVRRGAQDYLVKGRSDGEAIARAIHYAMDRKRGEEELRKARDELETRVRQRTEQLTRSNAELAHAKQAAEAASRAKSAFLTNMSHELRTPLGAIIGMTELVLKGELQAEQRECLAAAKDSAESLLALIDNVLELSSIEAGKLSLAAAAFNLRQSLDDALRPLALQARQRDLQFLWQVDPGVPRLVTGDWNRLRQIVASLVGNAVKFTDRGDVSLEVSQDAIIDRLVFLHFVVRDTGIGIPQEKQAAIFGMFEQADASLARRHGGAGLGLAIAARLAALMDGRLWVESEIGRGSRFHFTVRLGLPPAGQVAAEEPATRTPCGAPCTQGQGRRVLMVDDSLVNQKLVAALLESEGHAVTVAGNRARFLAVLGSEMFDLVLLDVELPDLDQREAVARIRASQEQAGVHIPIIGLISHSPEDSPEQFLEAGLDGFVGTPLQGQALLAAIDTAWMSSAQLEA